jgi:hypothetical protein
MLTITTLQKLFEKTTLQKLKKTTLQKGTASCLLENKEEWLTYLRTTTTVVVIVTSGEASPTS